MPLLTYTRTKFLKCFFMPWPFRNQDFLIGGGKYATVGVLGGQPPNIHFLALKPFAAHGF